MKHLAFTIDNQKKYDKAKSLSQKTKYTAQLIQVFSGVLNIKKVKKAVKNLQKDFPKAIIIGTSTAGEIANAKMYNNSLIVSVSLFEKTALKTSYVKKINRKQGKALAKNVCTKHTKAMVIFSEGLKGKDYIGFVEGIQEKNTNVIVSGGLAGDNVALKKTFVFLKGKFYSKGAVAVSFSGEALYADNRYNLSWTPLGKKFTITGAKGSIIHTIDHVPAKQFFKQYLGQEVLKNKKDILLNFQLLYKGGVNPIARTPMRIDGDSIVLAGPIKQGQVVQFGFSSSATVLTEAQKLAKFISKKPAEGIYVYSCISRKILLGKKLQKEFMSFNALAPTAGFFTYGEFYTTTKSNTLLNCTSTLLILSEKIDKPTHAKALRHKDKSFQESVTFSALMHFIDETEKELTKNTQLLNQYKNIVDNSSIVSKTDPKGFITYVNQNFCRISGYSQEELLGQNHNIVRDPKVSTSLFRSLWETIQSGKIWKGSFRNRSKDGSYYYVDTTIMPILDKNGEIEEYIAIRRDITKLTLASKKIAENERLVEAIFNNQDSIVLYLSKDKKMLRANRKLFEYLDVSDLASFKQQYKCVNELFEEREGYLSPLNYEEWLDDIAEREIRDEKVTILAKDGKEYIFKILVKRIKNRYIVNLYDITSLENALLQARASEEAKTIFLANMSHEIRTPLNGILGFIEILSSKVTDAEAKRYISIIQQSGTTLLNIVNDILDFSKITSGEFTLYKTETSFFEELEGTLSLFNSMAVKRNIKYDVRIDPAIPARLFCDMQRIKQVMNNLISNAVKFTPEGGFVKVEVSLQKREDEKAFILFKVEDSGIGVAKEKIETIFNAFSQEDNSTSKKFGGTGLGLAISNQFIKMMGSKIEVKSQKNVGSTFYFSLELDILDSQVIIDAGDTHSDNYYKGRVLIAEDNETNQILLTAILNQKGVEYKVVNNGQEAVDEVAKNDKYDLILMDINMPIMDGVEATKILRKRDYIKPIVSLSANVIDKDVEIYKAAGVNDSLNKPIVTQELDKILHKYLTEVNCVESPYDTVCIETISKELSISDVSIIYQLLESYKKTALGIIEKLKTEDLDEITAHTLKGISGNLRFNKLYEYVYNFEKELASWETETMSAHKRKIIEHLEHIVKEIDALDLLEG